MQRPYSYLLGWRRKRLETRSRMMHYKGPIAIHSSRSFPRASRDLCATEPFRSTLDWFGIRDPMEMLGGSIIATGIVRGCYPVPEHPDFRDFSGERIQLPPTGDEREFGGYSNVDGQRYAILIDDVRMLNEPIPALGRLGLWDYDLEMDNPPGGYVSEEFYLGKGAAAGSTV